MKKLFIIILSLVSLISKGQTLKELTLAGSGTGGGGTSSFVLTSIAGIRSNTTPSTLLMYYTLDSAQQGLWYYDPSDATTADNTGVVLVSSNGKRFKRIYNRDYVPAEWFGAKADGITNCKVPVQTALNYFHGNVTMIFNGPNYAFWNTVAATYYWDVSTTVSITNQISRILVCYSGTKLKGAGPGVTKFTFLGTNGVNPDTNWDVFVDGGSGNIAERCPGIEIKQLDALMSTDTLRDIWVTGIYLYGGTHFTGNATYTNTGASGDGWDLGHKPVFIYAPSKIDNFHLEECEIGNWRGEGFWTGISDGGNIYVKKTKFHDLNASAVSCGGSMHFDDLTIYNAVNGFECYPGPGKGWIHGCTVYNISCTTGGAPSCAVLGGAIAALNDRMNYDVAYNDFSSAQVAGILLTRQMHGVRIHDNHIKDCPNLLRFEPQDTLKIHDIWAYDNFLEAEDSNVAVAVGFYGNTKATNNINIFRNKIGPSMIGVINGKTVATAFDCYQLNGTIAFENNDVTTSASGITLSGTLSSNVMYPRFRGNTYTTSTSKYTFQSGVTYLTYATSVTLYPLENQAPQFTSDLAGQNSNCTFEIAKIPENDHLRIKNGNTNTTLTFQASNTSVFNISADKVLQPGKSVEFYRNDGKLEIWNQN